MKTLLITLLALLVFAAPAEAGPLAPVFSAVGGAIKAALTVKALAISALKLAVSAGLSLLMQKRAQKKQRPTGLETSVTTTGGTDPQGTIIGFYATPGHMTYRNSHGANNRFLTEVIEVSDIAGVGLNRLIIDGEYSDIGATAHPDYGYPIVSKHDGTYDRAWIRFLDGTQSSADAKLVELFGNDPDRPWTADHVLSGIAYAILTYDFNPPSHPNGVPRLRFELTGIALYDPRLDSSVGGSGPQRWQTPSTWAQTDNALVLAYNILRGIETPTGEIWGGDAAAEDLPLDQWTAAMNACDLLVGNPGRPQFRAGLEIRFNEEPAGVLEEILSSANAQICELGGVWHVQVGAPAPSVLHITDEDILVTEPQQFEPFPGLERTYNAIAITHPSPGGLWGSTSLETITNAEWEAQDGTRRVFDLRLPAVPWPEQARQVALNMIRDERRFRKHSHSLPPEYFILRPLDAITWTSEWNLYTDKIFEIAEVAYDLRRLNVAISIRERDPNDFDPDLSLELPDVVRPTTPVISIDAGIPGFALEGIIERDDAGKARRPALRATWSNSIAPTVAGIAFQLRAQGQSDLIWTGSTAEVEPGAFVISGVIPGVAYEMRAKAVAPSRATYWTGWEQATAPDQKMKLSDLEGDVWNSISADARAVTETLLADTHVQRLMSMAQDHVEHAREREDLALAKEDMRARHEEGRLALVTIKEELLAKIGDAVAQIVEERSVRADEDLALAQVINLLSAAVEDNVASIISEQTARADGDGALASSITALSTTVGDQSTTISQHTQSLNGIAGEYTVRIDNNGHISGMVLRSDLNNLGVATSAAAFLVDKFAIVGAGGSEEVPFQVLTSPQVINGITYPAGVYSKKAIIGQAVIGRAQVTDVIESDNYAQDGSGEPTQGLRLNFATGELKAAGPVIARNVTETSGSYNIGSSAINYTPGSLKVLQSVVFQTDLEITAWEGLGKTYIADAKISNVAVTSPTPNSCRWGCTATLLPLTAFYPTNNSPSGQFAFLKVDLWGEQVSQIAQQAAGGMSIDWTIYRVS